MSLFDIDYSTQVNNLLPSVFRTNTVKKLTRSLIESCNTKAIEYSLFDADVRKRAKFNGQKLVLQEALNNIYNITVAPFILIETIQDAGQTIFIFNDSENQTEFIYNESEGNTLFVFNDAEISNIFADFIVKIPDIIYTTELEDRVTAEVTNYKLSGKRFVVQQYTP